MERNNRDINRFGFKQYPHTLTEAFVNKDICLANLRWKAFKFWAEKGREEKEKIEAGGEPPALCTIFNDPVYGSVFQSMGQVWTDTFSLEFWRNELKINRLTEDYRLCAVFTAGFEWGHKYIRDKIIENNIVGKINYKAAQENTWLPKHTLILNAFIETYNIEEINEELITKLQKLFARNNERNFTSEKITAQCQKLMGNNININIF